MKIFAIAVIFFSVGCSMIDIEYQTPLSGMSVDEAWVWIDENITFKSDFIDDFQLPKTTYLLRTGDCEDFCILMMSIMNQFGTAPNMIAIYTGGSIHYIVFWRGKYFEPQVFNKKYTPSFVESHYLWEISYYDAIKMSH